MTQLDKLRSMPVEEVAKGRVRYVDGYWEGNFGMVEVTRPSDYQPAYAEALRLEIEFLNSEVPMPVAEGMCCDCIRPNRHSICGDYSENSECKYRLEDGSCWAGKEAEGEK